MTELPEEGDAFEAGATDDSSPSYDDGPLVDAGDAGPSTDAGSAPSLVLKDAAVAVDAQNRDSSTIVIVDAAPPTVDASAPLDAAIATPDANISIDGGTSPDAATDAGAIIVLPVEAGPPPKSTPYLERTCSAPIECSGPYEVPKDPNVYTVDSPLCVAKAPGEVAHCSFYCVLYQVINGTEYWVGQEIDPIRHIQANTACTSMGGACVAVGQDQICLPTVK